MLFHLAPDKGLVQEHIAAVAGMNRRTLGVERLLGIDHIRQRLVFDADLFGGVLGLRARFGYDRDDPFADIAHLFDGKRIAPDIRRVQAVHQGIGRFRKLFAGQHIVHAGHVRRLDRIDRDDARGRMLRAHQRHMQKPVERDVGDKASLTRDEAAVFAHAAIGGNEFQRRGRGHWRPPCCVSAFTDSRMPFSGTPFWLRGAFALRSRSEANSTASTIWP